MTRIEEWLDRRLSAAEQQALRRQGFVSLAPLSSGAIAAKLRFRDQSGRQRAVYVGVDQELTAALHAWLSAAQQERRSARLLRAECRSAGRAIRARRRQLAPTLKEVGYYHHGWTLRRRRAPSTAIAEAHFEHGGQ